MARSWRSIPKRRLSSFSLLQQRSQLRDRRTRPESGVAVKIYLFDCLFSEGIDLTGLPLIERKSVLRDIVRYDDDIVFTPFRTRGAAAMLRQACARGAEGIVAKRAASDVCERALDRLAQDQVLNQQEFVIGGYTPPQGARERLGALLVGYYEGDALRYAGKVGTGYDRATLEMLYRRLSPIRRARPPFAPGPLPSGAVTWVAPRLVAEVGFSEWTTAGLLRHPSSSGSGRTRPLGGAKGSLKRRWRPPVPRLTFLCSLT